MKMTCHFIAAVALAVCFILGSVQSAPPPFKCQQTIDTYNRYVNIGQFATAANLTFTDKVRYVIPGPKTICPYCDTYNGKAEVVGLFLEGFLGHFTIVNPLVNLRQISTGMSDSTVRLMDFNQEAFVTNPAKTKGGRGVLFSVPVIHDFTFDPTTCLIKQMILFQDPWTVVQVYQGKPAFTQAIMPFTVFEAPPSTFTVQNASANDFQVFPSEGTVDEGIAEGVARSYYTCSIQRNASCIKALFMPTDPLVPQFNAAIFVPGDFTSLPYAGMFLGLDQVLQYHTIKDQAVTENNPFASTTSPGLVREKGSLAVTYTLQGTAASGKPFTCEAVDYFQVVLHKGTYKIGRLSRFFDTYAVTQAVIGK